MIENLTLIGTLCISATFLFSVRVEGSATFKGFFVTARDSTGQAVGTMTSADTAHQTMCDDSVRA